MNHSTLIRLYKWYPLIVLWSSALSCSALAQVRFDDMHLQAGLTLRHRCAGTDPVLPRLMIAGLAVFDFDNDGNQDILLLDQAPVDGLPMPNNLLDSEQSNLGRLYRNCGNGKFLDVTRAAGLEHKLFSLGAVAGDMDNDGDQDLFVSCFGPLQFFVNQGDGTFMPARELPRKDDGKKQNANWQPFGAGVSLLDIDNDGLLDLFEGRYVDFSMDRYRSVLSQSFPYPPGPKDFLASSDLLFKNLGNGDFEDITAWSGIDRHPGPTMGVIAGDWDGDADADIFLCSDAAPNQLLVNNGRGQFDDQALTAGLAYDLAGNVNGSMGVDAGDFDNDGLIDLLLTNYNGQIPILYKNLGGGMFEDVSRRTQIGRTVLPHTNWGVAWIDVDNDGDLDAFMANGHFLENIHKIDSRTDFRVTNTLMENLGGRFRDISKSAGSGLLVLESSRGAGFADFDRDGDLDGVILNAFAEPTLLVNNSTVRGNWIALRLIGRQVNRDAIGAHVSIKTNSMTQVAMVYAGRGYQSHYGTTIHFGIGSDPTIDSIEVTWPGGKTERFECSQINRELCLLEDIAN